MNPDIRIDPHGKWFYTPCPKCGGVCAGHAEMVSFTANDPAEPLPEVRYVKQSLNPAVAHVLQFFEYAQLPPQLQPVSEQFQKLAYAIAIGPQNPETTVALRKLLEAKECAVRAVVAERGAGPGNTGPGRGDPPAR